MAVMRPHPAGTERREPEPIEALFEALESPLLNYAWRLAGDPAAAEDIVQDAFMKLHEQFDQVREPRRWLYRTVHNLALNHRRKEGRILPLEPLTQQEGNNSDGPMLPDEEIARWEGIGLVRLSLELLDERSRELVRLKFNENLSYRDIAARTGLTTGNVGYLLHHAIKRVADELARNGMLP